MKKFFALFSVVALLGLASCSVDPVDTLLNNYETFINETVEASKKLAADDEAGAQALMQSYFEKMATFGAELAPYADKLTEAQTARFATINQKVMGMIGGQ